MTKDFLDNRAGSVQFTEEYKNEIFMLWWANGKPNTTYLHQTIPPFKLGSTEKTPSRPTLDEWMKSFKEKAEKLDEELMEKLSATAIAEKVKMLERHIDVAMKMQNMAIDFLENAEDSLNSNSAVRLLIEGLRIERQSRSNCYT